MTSDDFLSKTISSLRFPLMLGVVFLHNDFAEEGFSMHGVKYGLDNPYWYYLIFRFISQVLALTCVPLFFLFSGFLFFYRSDFNGEVYRQKLATRTRTLLVPYLLWNTIAILFTLAQKLPVLSSVFTHADNIEVHWSPIRIFNTYFADSDNGGIFVSTMKDAATAVSDSPYPIDGPLWYVRELMVMILLAPVVYWLMKRMQLWLVVALGIAWCLLEAVLMPNGGWLVLLSKAAFFFSWGAYYSINKTTFTDAMGKHKWVPCLYLLMAIADTLTKNTAYNPYIHYPGIVAGVVAAVVVVSALLQKGMIRANDTLAGSSFFIYALHIMMLHSVGKLLFVAMRCPDNTYAMLFLYFATPVLTAAIGLILYQLSKYYLTPMWNWLSGGR
jgi:surface polysaccharide O-acyltransferase-like enzyme